MENAIFYEIYPQSFRDANGDGIGDFQGIIEKLDYILDLGCNAIWLNPCFRSPFGDAGYDVSDYYTTAPRYGTNEDLQRLFQAVHERNRHILVDLVPGHTSVEHPWFKNPGKIKSVFAQENKYPLAYLRSSGDETILVILNPSSEEVSFPRLQQPRPYQGKYRAV